MGLRALVYLPGGNCRAHQQLIVLVFAGVGKLAGLLQIRPGDQGHQLAWSSSHHTLGRLGIYLIGLIQDTHMFDSVSDPNSFYTDPDPV